MAEDEEEIVDNSEEESSESFVSTRLPAKRGAGREQYITTSQLYPEGYPVTPELTNEDYFPNVNQPLQIGGTPSTYFGGQIPIFSGRGNIFPINTYTKRARALENAAYMNELSKLRREQQAGGNLKNLFKTPDFKDPFYSQQLYNMTNDLVARTKEKLGALAGWSNQEMERIINNPRTPEEQEVTMEWHRGMGQIKSMDNVANYLADTAVKVEEAHKDKTKIVLPEMDNLIRDYRDGKFPLGSPELSSFPQRLGIVNNVNEELNSIANTIKTDTRDEGGRRKTFKNPEDVKAYLEAYIGDNLETWSVGAGKYKNGRAATKSQLVDYYTPRILAALGKGDELNALGIERAKPKDKEEKIYDIDVSGGGTYPMTQFINKKTGESKVAEVPTTAHWDIPNVKDVQGLQVTSSNWLSPETGKRGTGVEERTGTRKVDVSAIDKFYVIKNKELGTWEISHIPTDKQMLFATVNSTGETSLDVDATETGGTQKEFTATYLVPYDDIKGKLKNAKVNLKGIDEQPKNITQSEYAQLKKGDKYFYNGQEYTKE